MPSLKPSPPGLTTRVDSDVWLVMYSSDGLAICAYFECQQGSFFVFFVSGHGIVTQTAVSGIVRC